MEGKTIKAQSAPLGWDNDNNIIMITSSDSCISVPCTGLKTVLQVCSEGGLLPAPLIDGGPVSQLVQVTFTPRYLM
jgi:hypothetical protein